MILTHEYMVEHRPTRVFELVGDDEDLFQILPVTVEQYEEDKRVMVAVDRDGRFRTGIDSYYPSEADALQEAIESLKSSLENVDESIGQLQLQRTRIATKLKELE